MRRVGIFFSFLFILFSLVEVSKSEEKRTILPEKIEKKDRGTAEQPLRVNAQTLELDNKNQVITFKGNVIARQGEMTIQADTARVYYDKKAEGHEIREIVAIGNVKIYQGNRLATSERAVFYNQEQKIILTGQPKVWQGKDMLSGEKITVLLKEDKSFVESGPERRVEVIFYPKGVQLEGKEEP